MATDDRRKDRPLEEILFQEGHRFDFFQAVKLIESFDPAAISLGAGANSRAEALRIKSRVRLEFPASEIFDISRTSRWVNLEGPLRRLNRALDGFTADPALSAVLPADHRLTVAAARLATLDLEGNLEKTDSILRDCLAEVSGEIYNARDRARADPSLGLERSRALMLLFEEVLSSIQSIQFTLDRKSSVEMTVTFMSLAGWNGPLPVPYTETIIARAEARDVAALDFLDIFNHRLVSLFYRARQQTTIGVSAESPDRDDFSRMLYSLSGLGSPGLAHRMAVPDRALLRYAALVQWEPHSLVALRILLADYFAILVRIEPWTGEWLHLEENQWTRLGLQEKQNVLGVTAMMGVRVWNQQSKFRIYLGPLKMPQFLQYLPAEFQGICPAHSALVELTRYFVGYEVNFDLCLELSAEEAEDSRLGDPGNCRLGWTSRLASAKSAGLPLKIVLNPQFGQKSKTDRRGAQRQAN